MSGLIFLKNLNFGYLLDFYRKVLPDRTAEMIDLYYNEDLSLAEIADNFGITRQGVRDAIKRGEDELTKLEENLKLTEKIERLDFEIEKLKKIAQDKNYTDILKQVDVSKRVYLTRNGHGEYAYPMGEHQVLLLLPVELHVLALFHVELCRTTERHTG